MKKLIIILFVFFITSFKTQAQGNLQFNSVKTIEVSNSPNYNGGIFFNSFSFASNDTSFVVPTGKVWKIESASTSYWYPVTGSINYFALLAVDGKYLYGFNVSNGTFPLWLSSGNHTLSIITSTSGYKGSINAIEFNITP